MKLSVSNIAWSKEQNDVILKFMRDNGFSGLEIAPTMLIPINPYDNINEIKKISNDIKISYGLDISSMQSIWYGQTGNIFNEEERILLFEYTKKAICFAEAINCKNLVFGCPKNRNIPDGHNIDEIVSFFKQLGDYAYEHNTIIALEANPIIYNTNFLNYTYEAIEFAKKVNSKGVMVNLDLGTMIENNESIDVIAKNIDIINHIHISEPCLEIIKERALHKELSELLHKQNYDKYVSIEMKNTNAIEDIENAMIYVKKIFK